VVTGQYMKRIYEFGVYRALGRSKREVKTKVAAEIIGMNVMACAIGIGISSIFTYLINELLYIPTGRYLLYFSDLGIKGFLLCDLLVVIPLVLSKGRMMCKADVTEF
ncbi:MAG: FtsX-like permease family protein, partial [Lachnospiraceae bacterium]|nr:FtsX-like permease family protein [Lachnospiraceae bacterium]